MLRHDRVRTELCSVWLDSVRRIGFSLKRQGSLSVGAQSHMAPALEADPEDTAPGLWQSVDEASSPAGPRSISHFSRRTADGPKRRPLPWRRRWPWLRSSCEPGGKSRRSAAPWAASGELRPRNPGWDGACLWEALGTSLRDRAGPDAGLRSKTSCVEG